MNKMTAILAVCCFASVFLLVNVPAYSQEIEVKDGVKLIHNEKPLWRDSPKLKLEFVRRIGDLKEDDENSLFYSPNDFYRDTNENLYVADYANHHIKKFNRDGKFLNTIGRPGQGPGDLFLPTCIDMDADGNIYVCHQRGLSILDSDGKYIDGFKTGSWFWNFIISGQNEITTYEFSDSFFWAKKGKKIPLFRVLNNEGKIIREFGERKDYENLLIWNYGNEISATADSDKNIYVVFMHQNRIEKYSPDGKLLFRVDRSLDYELKHKIEKEKHSSRSLGISNVMDVVKMTLVSAYISVDGKGRIWIMTRKKQSIDEDLENLINSESWEYEIFDKDGVLLCKLPLIHNHHYKGRMRIFNDQLYHVERILDACIYEYEIIEK